MKSNLESSLESKTDFSSLKSLKITRLRIKILESFAIFSAKLETLPVKEYVEAIQNTKKEKLWE